MSRLDRLLRRLLARWCSPQTMERVVDAVLADTDHERRQALAQGSRWQAGRVGLRGTAALCGAVAAQLVHALATWEPAPSRRARQAMWIGAGLSVASTVLLATLPYLAMFAHHRGNSVWLLLGLLPSAMPLGLTVGPVAAACWMGVWPVAAGHGGRRRVWAAALACSVFLGVLLSWAVPVANQRVRGALLPGRLLVARGVAELTLPELGGVVFGGTRPADLMPRETPATAALALHGRVALTLGPLLLTFVAIGVDSRRCGAPARLCGGLFVLALYVAWWFGVAVAEAPEHHYLLAAWTPALLTLGTGLLLRLSRPPRTES